MNSEHIDIRQHILDMAKPIILGKGFSGAGLNELLCAAQVPKGSFYHYFKSKESFGEALLEHYFADYLVHLEVLFTRPDATAAERLMDYWQLWLETQASDGPDGKCLAVKLGSEVSDLSEAMRATLQSGTSQIIARLATCIRAGTADASLPQDIDADHAAQTLYQMWLGATLLAKIRRDRSALDSAMAATVQLLKLTGISSR